MKNISAKFIIKVAGTLTAISLVVAALLGFVNSITWEKIAAINEQKTLVALAAVAAEGTEFAPVEVTDAAKEAALANGGTISELYTMSTGGYACKVVASGSQGSIEMIVGVDDAGAITGISVVKHAETSGIGTKVMGNDPLDSGVGVLDQFIGQSGAGSLAVGKTITAISGATVSSKGVTAGANAALAAVAAIA